MSPLNEAHSKLSIPAAQKMAGGELLLLCCSVISLVVSCVLWSSRKQEWVDEIYTWTEVSDRSLSHLYYAIQHGADGGLPLFYTTVWAWAKVFGGGTLALRLYSCIAFCSALVIVWQTLRRAYGLNSTAFGTLMIFGTSALVLNQNAEARFYGLFTLTLAIVIAFYVRLAEQENPKLQMVAGAMLAQAALALSHILGVIYGALVLFALILFDATRHRFRIRVYLSQAIAWLSLLIWLPAILASVAAGKPHGWIPMPATRDVLSSYSFEMWLNPILLFQVQAAHTANRYASLLVHAVRHSLLLMVAVALLTAAKRLRRDLGDDPDDRGSQKTPLIIVALSILTTPLVLLALSRLLTPIYVPRYALPSALGLAIILTVFAHELGIDRIAKLQSFAGWTWAILLVVLVSMPVVSALILLPNSVDPEYLDVSQLEAVVPPNVPVVVGWQHDFFKLMRYSQRKDISYIYLLDWPTALKGNAEFVPDYHLMSSYRKVGYYAGDIQDQNDFLCTHPYFLVLDYPMMSWLEAADKEVGNLRPKVIATVANDRRLIAIRTNRANASCRSK